MQLLGLTVRQAGGPDRAAQRAVPESLPAHAGLLAGLLRDHAPAFAADRHAGPEQIAFARHTGAGALLPMA